MGLDMYLYLRKYESACEWQPNFETKKKDFYPEELKSFANEIANRNFMSKTTNYQVGYWRKDNAIHNWFVNHCADGEDDCRPIYVSLEKARELLKTIKQIKATPELAKKLLPTQDGFFFGDTEYDEWYFNALDYTEDLLIKAIKMCEEKDYDIIYQASW